MVHSVYIHIPFCHSICSYCDFCKVFYQEELVDKYLDYLEYEIKNTYCNEVIKTLYIGGGTPSSLTILQLKRLFSIIRLFHLSSDCEITIEANFDSLDEEKILFLKDKITRISLGVETIDSKLQTVIERKISKDEIIKKISLLKKHGITNINLDLMYALPGENLEQVKSDVLFLLSLDVPHISTYSFILEEHTKLKLKNVSLIDEEIDADMYEFIENTLLSNGYLHYEISNYAKKGYESQHNLVYWKNEHYYGFGIGAASYISDKRKVTSRSLSNYLQGIIKKETETLSFEDTISYEVMLRLRLEKGISKKEFLGRYQRPIEKFFHYHDLIKQGYLIDDGNSLFISKKYRYVSNEIIVKFLDTKV